MTISNLKKNGRKFSKWIEITVGKGEIARDEQFLFFPTVFSQDLYCRNVKTRACLGKGSNLSKRPRSQLNQKEFVVTVKSKGSPI